MDDLHALQEVGDELTRMAAYLQAVGEREGYGSGRLKVASAQVLALRYVISQHELHLARQLSADGEGAAGDEVPQVAYLVPAAMRGRSRA